VRIDIRDYDPAWPIIADTARADLLAALPGAFTEIEHIGSTSVPGLPAKPIIDLMAAADRLDTIVAADAALDRLGYRREETGMPQRLFYRREFAGQRTHHLHVVPADTWATRNERLLRDHLRNHPTDAARYAALKRHLADASGGGDAYTRGKTDLIQQLTDHARVERGLPTVPVWEE
jgi:GrpB-like predicted nucleotidyltransferase (UPF0157 family)